MIEFQTVTDQDLLKATLLNRSRLVPSGCWVWTRASKRAGYGLFARGGKTYSAHRVSYEAFKGPIPEGMVVRHACDNPGCINPNHLSVGTMKDNMADRDSRGRRDVRGEQIGTSKLTAKEVLEIRAESKLSLREMGEKYGVDKSNIWQIRAGKAWRHLDASIGLVGR